MCTAGRQQSIQAALVDQKVKVLQDLGCMTIYYKISL